MHLAAYLFYLINTYGYVAVFVGSIFEAETIILLAGLLVSQGHLSFPLIILFAFLGAFASDFGWFMLGRHRGDQMLNHFAWVKKLASKPVGFVGRKPALAAFFVRFLYGFRHIVPFSIGMTEIPTKKFVALNSLGAIVWVSILTLAGYVLGDFIQATFGNLHRFELIVVVAIVSILVIFNSIARLIKKLLLDELDHE